MKRLLNTHLLLQYTTKPLTKIIKIVCIAGATFTLSSCFFVAGAAAGAAAIAVVYDHRTLENVVADTQLANKVANKIANIPGAHESHIEVTAFNHIILLTGETPDPTTRTNVGTIASSVNGVYRVYNQLTIEGPTSSLTRTSDSWITTKIKSKMLATEDLKSSSIKVVTENGTVYLMGLVKHNQADIAVEIARNVSGVERVVKIFQYR